MKIKVIDETQIGTLSSGSTLVNKAQTLVSIVDEPHNIQFDHAEDNLMFFRIFRFPKKDVLRVLTEEEGLEATITGAYLRAAFRVSNTDWHKGVGMAFIVRYTIKEQAEKMEAGVLNCYTIKEKEKTFAMERTDDEVIRMVEPYLIELDAVNSKASAAKLRECFNDWAHPLTLEAVTEGLTDEQKLKAAKIIRELFRAA